MADTSSWLNITSSDTAMGSVSFSPDPSEASDGDEITVSASPASGYHFAGWSDTGSVDNPRTIITGTAITAKAVFISESDGVFPSVNMMPKPWWMSSLSNYLKSFLSVTSGASKINTQDKGDHFDSNTVEGQLQELGVTTEATDLVINTPAALLSKLPAQLTGKTADYSDVAHDIDDNTITTSKITDLNVTTPKLVDDAVVNSKIADNAIQTENIVDLNVTTNKVADKNITNIKLADTAVKSRTVTGTSDGTDYTASGFQLNLDGTGTISMPHLREASDGKMFYNGCVDFNGYITNPYLADFTTATSNKYILIPVRPAGSYTGCMLYQLDFCINSMLFSIAATSERNEWGDIVGKNGCFIRAHGILDNNIAVRFLSNDGALYIELGITLGNFFNDTQFRVHIIGFNLNVSESALSGITASPSASGYTENMSRKVANGGADMVTAMYGNPNPTVRDQASSVSASSIFQMGYRVWSSGLIEQWGWADGPSGNSTTRATLTLMIPYRADHSYALMLGNYSSYSATTGTNYGLYTQTSTQISLQLVRRVARFWYTIGY